MFVTGGLWVAALFLRLAVAGFLVFFRSGGDALAAKFFGIVLAEQDVPFFAAFQDFFLLGSDAFADFHFDFFFFAKDIGHCLDHVLTDGVAILDEFHLVGLHQQIYQLMRDAHNFFAAQSHSLKWPLFPSLAA
jgi:hypothetical protein